MCTKYFVRVKYVLKVKCVFNVIVLKGGEITLCSYVVLNWIFDYPYRSVKMSFFTECKMILNWEKGKSRTGDLL